MTPGGEPDLTEGTPVRVDLDAGGSIECTVFAFVGPVILARYETALDLNVAGELVSGADAYLVVEQDRGVKALRGSATLNGESTLALRITDAFSLGQRRESTRVALVLDAGIAPVGGDATPTATRTIDVSLGGVQVQRPEAMPVADRYALTLEGENLGAPVVTEAALARELPDALGLRFTHIEPDDRRRLMQLVLANVTVPVVEEAEEAEAPES